VEQTEPIKVMIVDDHPMVRQGLRTFFSTCPDIRVIAEAGNGVEALEKCAQTPPDVVLMDMVMPKLDGVEAMQRIRAARPQTRVIVLTSFGDDETLLPAVRAGASGYILKSAEPREVVRAIRAAHAGEAVIDSKSAARLFEALARPQPSSHTLTPRELEVLACVCNGLSNKRIAGELGLSEKTVKAHVGHILAKLGVTDRTQAALLAVREGLTEC
jgi:NarL family two-component system response regulator LiaR